MSDRTLTLTIEASFGPRDVALLVAGRKSIKQEDQATLFDVSRPTIISAIGRVYAKLNADGMTDAVMTAFMNGILLKSDDDTDDDTLRRMFAAGSDWSKVDAAPVDKPSAPAKATTPRKPSRRKPSGKVTTRKVTGTAADKLKADKVTAATAARRAAGVAS